MAGVLPELSDVGRQGPVLCIEVKAVPSASPSSFAGGGRGWQRRDILRRATPERPLCGRRRAGGHPARRRRFPATAVSPARRMLDRAEDERGPGRHRSGEPKAAGSRVSVPSRSCPRRRGCPRSKPNDCAGSLFCSQWGGRALRSPRSWASPGGRSRAGRAIRIPSNCGRQSKAVNCTYLKAVQDDMVDGYLPEASLRGITVWSNALTQPEAETLGRQHYTQALCGRAMLC